MGRKLGSKNKPKIGRPVGSKNKTKGALIPYYEVREPKNEFGRPRAKNSVVTLRVFQAIFLGVFALGLSMMAGDYAAFIQSPISVLSMVTTVFGGLGALITELIARQAAKW